MRKANPNRASAVGGGFSLNGPNVLGVSVPGLLPPSAFQGAEYDTYHYPNVNAGPTSVVSPPSGKKAVLWCNFEANPTAGLISKAVQMRYSASILRRLTTTTNAGANSTGRTNVGMVVEYGESFIINPGSAGLTLFGSFILLPASSGFKSPKLTTFVNGNNTLYQVPPGKVAYTLAIANTSGPNMFDTKSLQYTNDSGVGVTVRVGFVPNGVATNLAVHALNGAGSVVAAAGQLRIDQIPAIMTAGEKIVVNTDSNADGQFAGITVFEVNA